jgi:hypothetical protein
MGVLQKSGRSGSLSSAMIAEGPLDGRTRRFGAPAGGLEAIKARFVAEDGAERFTPAARFTIVVGGSALFWAAIAAVVVAVRH